MYSERMAWVRELTAPLVVVAIITAVQAWSPGFADHLGFLGDLLEWKWTPTLVFAALAAISLLVKRKKDPEGDFIDDSGSGISVESDGIRWVLRGWMVAGAHRTPVLDPECTEHHIPFHYKTIGRGEKLVPLGKATTFIGKRAFYCVGHEGAGHEVRPTNSKDMASAKLRADSRFRSQLRAMQQSESRTSAGQQQ